MPQHYTIIEYQPKDKHAWNIFLRTQPQSTYCHRFEWKEILKISYGLKTFYLAIQDEEDLIGIFPSSVMPVLPWSTKRAVSQPFADYGDVITTSGVDQEPIVKACLDYLSKQGIDRVEVRHRGTSPDAQEVTMLLNLPKTSDALWTTVGPKVRNQVRKAKKNGLTVKWGRDQVSDLYEIYSKNIGQLGTPVHSRRYFQEIITQFQDDVNIVTVQLNSRAIGALLCISHNDSLTAPFASSLPSLKTLNPNMLIYWETLKYACDKGKKLFDFGRSNINAGTFRFKKQWGAVPHPLHYCTYSKGEPIEVSSTNLYRSKKALFVSKIWSKLPLTVQQLIGPFVRQNLP